LNRLGVSHECDKQTDITVANAALNYVVWKKSKVQRKFIYTY